MKFPIKIFLFGGLSAALIVLQWSGPTFSEDEFWFILFLNLFGILLPVAQLAQLFHISYYRTIQYKVPKEIKELF